MNLNPFDPAYRKYGVVVLAAATMLLDAVAPVVPEKYKPWVAVAVAVVAALGVNRARNVDPEPVLPRKA